MSFTRSNSAACSRNMVTFAGYIIGCGTRSQCYGKGSGGWPASPWVTVSLQKRLSLKDQHKAVILAKSKNLSDDVPKDVELSCSTYFSSFPETCRKSSVNYEVVGEKS
ncbi:hypothetical protein E3N88_15218 [Mikania micrantha]|uniref:Uncharacterized protein n=1 Tax=Mikania micrantha TaxID=192012 RepID=A0A5N6NW95_9ASTR|nr:hypothetical protein E3N88_15218 [Mikania micrantha]